MMETNPFKSSPYLLLHYTYVFILGLLAFLDSFGSHVCTLDEWFGILVGGLVLSVFPFWGLTLVVYANKQTPAEVNSNKQTSKAQGSNPKSNSSTKFLPTSPYFKEKDVATLVRAAYYIYAITTMLLVFIQFVYLYSYTMDTPNYQSEINKGYPATGDVPRALFNKMQLLDNLQTLWVVQTSLMGVQHITTLVASE